MTYRRTYAIDLSPWARAAVGSIEGMDLPEGYRITGLRSQPAGPVSLVLHHAGTRTERVVSGPDAPAAFRSLVDLAWIDARERSELCRICLRRYAELGGICETCAERVEDERDRGRVVVTADAGGWIEEIEDA